ncbi:MAG: OadG family transporter subunit [Mangrovibacterium sp.]
MQNRINTIVSGIFVFLLLFSGLGLHAQNATDLRINEILVYNDSNYVDEYSVRSAWVEIVNSSYSKVNIGGCYLTDDLSNPTKYWIPLGATETAMAPRSYLVFFADNRPSRGIFHLNFELKEGGIIALFDAGGRNLIDKVEIPAGQQTDMSYARLSPESDQWEIKGKTTPGSDNDHSRKISSGDQFVALDPAGAGMTLIAMSVVFFVLILLYFVFKGTAHLFTREKRKKEQYAEEVAAAKVRAVSGPLSGEVNAAIATALYMYKNETHDFENTVLTVKKVARPYSPWSSKIYTLRRNPR